MRTIKEIDKPVYDPIDDLVTYRAIPTPSVSYIDPFLFLNHHGPQVYPSHNSGLPFGPHPHRGMETVTFIIDGDIAHYDSSGQQSIIRAGGVQWMTAGRGLIHAEVSSDAFKQQGGPLEILQLWVNLPSRSKMSEPFYKGLQKDSIPVLSKNGGQVSVQLISGMLDGETGPFNSDSGVRLCLIRFEPGSFYSIDIPAEENVFFYLIRGRVEVNGQPVAKQSLVRFLNDDNRIAVSSGSESLLLLGNALPLGEPVVAQGPFVMNTREEIIQAYDDYRNGKFGTWNFSV